MQHARGITNATGVHGHIDDLLLHLRRLTGVGIVQQKGPPTPLKARTAPIALLAFRRQTMSHDISPVTVWTMQHLGNHGPPTKLVALVLNRGYQINSFETPPARPYCKAWPRAVAVGARCMSIIVATRATSARA